MSSTIKVLILLFVVGSISSSCKKDDDDDNDNNTNDQSQNDDNNDSNDDDNNSSPIYFLSATLDGTAITVENGKEDYRYTSSYSSEIGSTFSLGYSCEFGDYYEVKPYYGLTFDVFYFGTDPWSEEDENFPTMFATGDYIFTASANGTYNDKGMIFSHFDSDGNIWSSSDGDQTGSKLTITSSVDGGLEAYDPDEKSRIVEGTFSCKLYRYDDESAIINVTNGSFRVEIISNPTY